jgi:hypothetical protein
MLLSGLLWRRILVYFVSECQSNTNSLTKWCNCFGIVAYFTSESWRTLLRNRGVLWSGIVAYYGAEYPVAHQIYFL